MLDQKGSKIVIETSGDVEVGSDAKLAVKAPSGVTLETTGDLEIKGNNVTIEAGGAHSAPRARQAKVEGSGSVEL